MTNHSTHSLFSLALASRGLAPARVARRTETFEPAASTLTSLKRWFDAVVLKLRPPRVTS